MLRKNRGLPASTILRLTSAAIVIALTLKVVSVSACSCPEVSLAEDFEISDSVFIGKAIQIEYAMDMYSLVADTVFLLRKRYKGAPSDTVRVRQHVDSCYLPFTIRGDYFVFSSIGSDGVEYTGLCSNTHGFTPGTLDSLSLGDIPPERSLPPEPQSVEQVSFTRGDFNADHRVDFQDFLIFAEAFGSSNKDIDLDADGLVGFSDLLQFAGMYESRSVETGFETIEISGVNVDIVWIPPGTYIRGTTQAQADLFASLGAPVNWPELVWSDETPAHLVTLSHGFGMTTTEVTANLWAAVMGGAAGNPTRAAEATIAEVESFLDELNADNQQFVFRLPTESEWEYACRAGTSTAWWWGDDPTRIEEFTFDGDNTIRQVPPNPWGLYDMLGNVGEWTADYYRQDSYGFLPQRDPAGPGYPGEYRVIRGFPFPGGNAYNRPSYRDYGERRSQRAGFRIVVERHSRLDSL